MIRFSAALLAGAVFFCAPAQAKSVSLINGLGMYIGPRPMGWIGYGDRAKFKYNGPVLAVEIDDAAVGPQSPDHASGPRCSPVAVGLQSPDRIKAVLIGAAFPFPAKRKTAVLVNGLGVYTKPGLMGDLKVELERLGYVVTVLNHLEAKHLTEMPDILIGHSLGANAALKRSQVFRKNPPKLIITIDPGRAPLFHSAHPSTRVVNLYCPYHPIGGQRISGAAHNQEICGTAHIAMPWDARVIAIIIKEIEGL